MRVYYPSMYGDFRLEATGEKTCHLITTSLSAIEGRIITDLLKKFKVEPNGDNTNSGFKFEKSISKVNAVMAKIIARHKGSETITAVRVNAKDEGHIQLEEIRGELKADADAVTTPVPKRGCPMPVFDPVAARHIRAEDVLKRFLRPHQVKDYQDGYAFVVFGGTTHHRYLVSHRYSRSAARNGIVCDLDDGRRRICVEASTLPPFY